jgi:DNA-binding transcriptional MerR regulator
MTISEVGKKYDISEDTLRWYERIGLINNVPRKSNGLRDYSEENCRNIEFIKCMRSAGLSIDFLQQYMNLIKKGDSTLGERKDLLKKEKQILLKQIDDMKITLDRLNFKIDHYEKMCADYESKNNEKDRK